MKTAQGEKNNSYFRLVSLGIPLLIITGLLAGGCCATNRQAAPLRPPMMAASAAADVLIISATYGTGTHHADVTYRVNDLQRQPNVVFHAHPNWLGADPSPGWNKELVVIYEYKGQRNMFLAGEGGTVSIEALIKSAKKKRHD